MTTVVYTSSNSTTTGFGTGSSFEDVLVTSDGYVTNDNGIGINLSGGSCVVDVQGQVDGSHFEGAVAGIQLGVVEDNTGGKNALIVGSTGVVSGDPGILVAGDNNNVTNAGAILGRSNGVNLLGSSNILSNSGIISAQTYGVVTSPDEVSNKNSSAIIDNSGDISASTYGMYLYSNDKVNNSGSISGDTAITVLEYNVAIDNSNQISGSTVGIQFQSGSFNGPNQVENTGKISNDPASSATIINSGNNNLNISNTGSIVNLAGGLALQLLSGVNRILNQLGGSIVGGIQMGGAADTLFNAGSILGAVDMGPPSSTADLLTNTGTIAGSVTMNGSLVNRGSMDGAVTLLSGTLRNSGAIDGDVTFQSGSNSFNGKGGTVEGAITGGSGVDTIYLGNDGETVSGGGGHDQLYGGTGADTFEFSSTRSLDLSTVHGFNVANDTSELLHSAYAALTAGVAPVFSIATAATSASDHLFYNTTSGMLYYDPDGSGSHVAYEIAHLAPGLKLTASNFSVV